MTACQRCDGKGGWYKSGGTREHWIVCTACGGSGSKPEESDG